MDSDSSIDEKIFFNLTDKWFSINEIYILKTNFERIMNKKNINERDRKRYTEEVHPIIIVLNRLNAEFIRFTGAEECPYDAIVRYKNGFIQKIEATVTIDGELEATEKQICHDTHCGVIVSPNDTAKSLRKSTNAVRKNGEWCYGEQKITDYEDGYLNFKKDAERVIQAIKRKIKDKYAGYILVIYDKNHILLSSHLNEYKQFIEEFIKTSPDLHFEKIFVVDVGNKFCLEF